MKTVFFIMTLMVLGVLAGRTQTTEKTSGFYDIKVSYIYSLKGESGKYLWQNKIAIPYGVGLSCSYQFNKNLFSEIGFAFKIEKKKHEYIDGTPPIIPDPGPIYYYIDLYHTYTNRYIDLPIQLHYNFISCKSVNLLAVAGFKGTLFLYHDYWNTYFDGSIRNEYGSDLHVAYCLGLIEKFSISNKLGVFASQNIGSYFYNIKSSYKYKWASSSYNKIFELKIGLNYKIN